MSATEHEKPDPAEEPPRKRTKLEDATTGQDVNERTILTEDPVAVARAQQSAQELKFGVTAYVSDLPGFNCILKQRYTDFLVNEVTPSGKVLHLEADPVVKPAAPAPKRKENGNVQNGASNGAAATATSAVTETEPEKAVATEVATSNENVVELSPEETAQLDSIFGEPTRSAMLAMYSKILAHPERKPRDLPQPLSEPIEDKQQRTDAHVAVRRIFKGRIETFTLEDNRISIKASSATNPRNRESHQRGDGPRIKGKVGWSELGGEHLHFSMYKENKDTMEVLFFLASQLKVHQKSFQFAGTKDRRGVTVQRVSVYRVMKERLMHINRSLRQARLCAFEHRPAALELGELAGNAFTIALRDCRLPDPSSTQSFDDTIRAAVDAFRTHGFINYYGLQRFGTYAVTTDEIGRRMLQGDLRGAVSGILDYSPALLSAAPDSRAAADDVARAQAVAAWDATHRTGAAVERLPRKFAAENAVIRHLGFVDRRSGTRQRLDDWQGALSAVPRNLRLMYVHAYQSLVWNTVAARRLGVYGRAVVEGDLVVVDTSVAVADAGDEVDDEGEVIVRPQGEDSAMAAADKFERARPLSRAEAESGRYTVFDIVLPLPGYDVVYPANAIGEFYTELMAKDGLDPRDMRRKWRDISLSGSYRKVMAKAEDVSVEIRRYGEEDEQLLLTDMDRLEGKEALENTPGDRVAVLLKLRLGSSQYATMALRELTKGGALAFKPEFSGR